MEEEREGLGNNRLRPYNRHEGGRHGPNIIIDEENNHRNIPRPRAIRAEDRQVAIGVVNQEVVSRSVTQDEDSGPIEENNIAQVVPEGENAVPYMQNEVEHADESDGQRRWVNSVNRNSRQR